MLAIGNNYKINKIQHIEKRGNTMIYLTSRVFRKDKGYKNYTFFVNDELLPYKVGDMIEIVSIESVDQEPYNYFGRQGININVVGTVKLKDENKSAIDREVKEHVNELPF